MSYRDAGVDIDAGDAVVRGISAAAARTHDSNVLRGLGHFGGFYRVGPAGPGATLVASTDSVGTKVMLAIAAGRHAVIGHDIVCHCVNDIVACGARPLFFLDYFGTGVLQPDVAVEVIDAVARACEAAGIALIGGETAEMPGVYRHGDYDLVGTIVGLVEQNAIIDGATIAPGDVLLGLPSEGFHTNGYSLVRAALRLNEMDVAGTRAALAAPVPFDANRTLADALLAPHRCYQREARTLVDAGMARGMAHITGGGLPGNVGRIIPTGLTADIDVAAWSVPDIFRFVGEAGNIAPVERYRAFNMGIGYVVVVRPEDQQAAATLVPEARAIGRVRESDGDTRVMLTGLEATG